MPTTLARKIRRISMLPTTWAPDGKVVSRNFVENNEAWKASLPVSIQTMREFAKLRRRKAIAARLKPKSDYRRSRNRRKSSETASKKK